MAIVLNQSKLVERATRMFVERIGAYAPEVINSRYVCECSAE